VASRGMTGIVSWALLKREMGRYLNSDIEIHRKVIGVDRGGFCMVDGDYLVLRNIIL
jgi:hypothetical protein